MSEKNIAPKKILVADDSLTIQKVIRLALSGDGYEIQTVSDGKEALEQASLFRPDICIIDVSLPIFDAYQIREQLLAKPDLKSIPVILMSSTFEKVDESRAQALGFSGHLIKPFDPSHLRSTLLSVSHLSPKRDPVIETINSPYAEEAVKAAAPKKTAPIHLNPPDFNLVSGQDFPPLQMDNPAVQHPSGGAMDDIQQMAKNTFEMSGLNQHDWGMIELGKDNSTTQTYNQPFDILNEVNSIDLNSSGNSHSSNSSQISMSSGELEQLIKSEVEKALQNMQGQLRDRIEHELRAEVHSQIPLMAEKIIKEEIHKLLSDPPV